MTSTAPLSGTRRSPADRLEIDFKSRKASHKPRARLWEQLKNARTYELVAELKAARRKQLAFNI